MSRRLREIDAKVLAELAAAGEAVAVDDLARRLSMDQSPVAGSVTILEQQDLVTVEQVEWPEYRRGPRARAFPGGEFPERVVARALVAAGGSATIPELAELAGLPPKVVGESLRWLAARGWAERDGARLRVGPAWQSGEPEPAADERLVGTLPEEGALDRPELEARGVPVDEALELLEGRSGVVDRKLRRRRLARITERGRRILEAGLETRPEVTELTTDLLVSGRWRDVSFRPYDVSLAGPRIPVGKEHPFRQILERTRTVFLEMGFEETASPWVESGFWDFDALFQPQDHPARDMQDTFYVARPDRARLPDERLVERVGATHENGGDTGSIGWRTRWDRELARKCVLRTHTTASTIRALAADPNPPRKVFCVGPVFRRETIDYKHLPVFHQVDGIVIDQEASFAALLGLLGTFYRKMGFEKIQFRPAFFPYTEPSVEVFVWMASRSDWVEMGGAGVFRPEVTEPLGCAHPVLAWGLGLERLAMFRLGLSDIREIYLSHLDWLEETPLCRS